MAGSKIRKNMFTSMSFPLDDEQLFHLRTRILLRWRRRGGISTATNATTNTTTDATTNSTSIDDLSLLSGLTEGLLKADASGKVGVLSRSVVDKEHLGLCGGSRHFDDLLVLGTRTLGKNVHESLLPWWGNDNGLSASECLRSSHEDEVVVDLGVRQIGGWSNLDLLGGRSGVQEDVTGDLGLDA